MPPVKINKLDLPALKRFIPAINLSGSLHSYMISLCKLASLPPLKTTIAPAKEIFPKQAKVKDKPGNAIAIPYRSSVLRYGVFKN